MSITSDIRAYADSALEQGKQVIDQAQAQFNDVTEDVTQRVSGVQAKATATIGDLRAQAEKTINIDAIKAAVEPYLAQAKEYGTAVTDRANGLIGTVTGDKRVAKFVETAEQVSGLVVGTVQTRVVKPVQDLTGLGKPAAKPARKATATKSPTKPAATRPAPKPTVAKPTATKSTTAKATAKAPARKAPAKKATTKA